jgi:hypothetical protein
MYIVMTAAAKMPSSVRSQYRRIAVVQLRSKATPVPKMISTRARGVRRIVETWERLNVGKGVRSAYTKALAEAEALCAELNAEEVARRREAQLRRVWQEAAE